MASNSTAGGGFTLSPDTAIPALEVVAAMLTLLYMGGMMARHPQRSRLADSGMLTNEFLSKAGKVVTVVFLPCLSFTAVATHIDAQTMREVWPLLVWPFLNMAILVTLSTITAYVFKVPERWRLEWVAGSCMTDTFAAPLVMFHILCKSESMQLSQVPGCYTKAVSLLFVPNLSYSIMFWMVWANLLTRHTFTDQGRRPEAGKRKTFLQTIANLFRPDLVALLFGVLVGCVKPLRKLFIPPEGDESFQAPLSFFFDGLETYGSGTAGLFTLVAAGSLGKSIGYFSTPRINRWMGWRGGEEKRADMKLSAAIAAATAAEESIGVEGVAMTGLTKSESVRNTTSTSNLVHMDVDLAHSAAEAGVGPTAALSVADGSALAVPADNEPDFQDASWPNWMFAMFTFLTMVVYPCILFPFSVFTALPLIDQTSDAGQMASVILLLQTAMPSAPLMVVFLEAINRQVAAQGLARASLFQFIFGLLSFTIFLAAALDVVYGATA